MMPRVNKEIVKLINSISGLHQDMIKMCTQGQCYRFAVLLRTHFPGGTIYYDYLEGHAYYFINQVWYDIRGAHLKRPESCVPLNHQDGHRPHRWGRGDRRRLSD